MRHRLLPALLSIAALAVVLFAGASGEAATSGSGGLSKPSTIAIVHDYVGALAQSKNRLAWLAGAADCPKAEILDLRRGRHVKVSSRHSRACHDPTDGSFGQLVFDGNRVLWQDTTGTGNTEFELTVFSAALNDRRTRALGGGTQYTSDYLPPLPLAGDARHLLFYDRCDDHCAPRTTVRTMNGRRTRKLFKATKPELLGLAVGGKRLAALYGPFADCCESVPAWSPDGKALAWIHHALVNGTDELVTANADGSRRRVLTSGYIPHTPSWSPDSSKLAFSSYRPTAGDLQGSVEIVNADGTGKRTLAPGYFGQWSPDGTVIAFIRGDDVYRINSEGSQEARLTSDAVGGTGEPRWSPDGKTLLVERGGRAYVVDSTGGGATVLPPVRAMTPAWSPNGMRIAFSVEKGIAVMNADGSGAHLVVDNSGTSHTDFDPAWSSDGAKIAFRDIGDPPEEGLKPQSYIFVINADGTGERRVGGGYTAGRPTWAPDRPLLAWAAEPYVGSNEILDRGGLFVASAEGRGLVRIAGGDYAPIEIRNSRSGSLLRSFVAGGRPGTGVAVAMSARYLAVVVRNESRLELDRYRADGTALGVSALPAHANPLSLTVGSQAIVYSVRRRIFAVDAATGATRLVATAAAAPVGLSLLNRRLVWAEDLGKKGARVRAINLSG